MNNLQTAIEALERIRDSDAIWGRGIANQALIDLRAMEGQTAPQPASPIPTDFCELAGMWSVNQGFQTWYSDHGAVMLNFCRWLTARLKGADHE